MQLTSLGFIVFLAVVFVLYYLIPKRFQWCLLLASSYVFYAWAGIWLPGFLIATTVSTYLVSLKLDQLHIEQKEYLAVHKKEMDRAARKSYKEGIKKKQWNWLLLCLLFNFGVLAVFKYTNFTIANINTAITALGRTGQLSFLNLVLPMGISFYIFQTMGYIIDVYRGTVRAERNIGKLALFVSFFPQLVQGPISRFQSLTSTMFKEHSFDSTGIWFGVQRILWGYYKKLVIADRLVPAVTTLFGEPGEYQGAYVFAGMLLYAVELYADFTGGIDITIGIGQIFGIEIAENFERPYFSKSIAEYWRRWHITMGTWFKDYLFYPISICGPMRRLSKWSRKHLGDGLGKRLPVYISTLFVWFITGLWHGASWNFIVWGVLNGVVILASQELSPFYRWFHKKAAVSGRAWYGIFQMMRTFFLMSSLRLLDCYGDVGTAFRMFGTMFTKWNYGVLFDGSLLNLGISMADYIVVLLGVFSMLAVSLLQTRGSVRGWLAGKRKIWQYLVVYLIFMAVVIIGAYGVGFDSGQFIYNQF